MDTYLVRLEAKPTKGALNYDQSGGAFIEIMVVAASAEEAESKAQAHVIDHRWLVKEIVKTLKLLPKHLALMDRAGNEGYLAAQRQGIYAFFYGWSKVERPGSGIVEVYSIWPPESPSGGKH